MNVARGVVPAKMRMYLVATHKTRHPQLTFTHRQLQLLEVGAQTEGSGGLVEGNSEEDDPQGSGVLAQHSSADSHAIENGVEAKTPHSRLVGVAVANLLLVALLVRAFFVFMFMLVLMLVLMLVFMLMLLMAVLVTVAVGVSEAAMSEGIGEHHHGKANRDANTNQTVGIHFRLLRLDFTDILERIGNGLGNNGREGGSNHQTSAQRSDDGHSSLAHTQPVRKEAHNACPNEEQYTEEEDKPDGNLVFSEQREYLFEHDSRSF